MRSNEEIKRGLECCFGGRSCNDCSYSDDPTDALCDDHLGRDALELIRAQERRIKELEADNDKLKAERPAPFIDVSVEEYCRNCPDFDAYTIKHHASDGLVFTSVCCINSAKCKRLYQRAKEAAEREGAKNED